MPEETEKGNAKGLWASRRMWRNHYWIQGDVSQEEDIREMMNAVVGLVVWIF